MVWRWMAQIGGKWVLGISVALALLTGLLISFGVWLSGVAPVAASRPTTQVNPVQATQSQQIRQERDRIQRLEQRAKTDLNQLNRSLKTTQQRLQVTSTTLDRSTARLNHLEQNLERSEVQYRQQQRGIVQRLQWLQRQPDRQGLTLLLQSDQLTEWLDRRHRLKRLYESERNALVTLQQQTDHLEHQRNQVEQQRNQILLLKQQLLAQQQQNQVRSTYQQQAIDRLTKDRRALEAALNQLTQDSASLSGLIRQRVSRDRQSVVVIGSGQLSYPVDAPVTSDFGWRIHPILGTQRFHGGIDFGADYGTVIRAAVAGQVLYADWYGGFGYTVILDHGNGITTLYAHCDGFYVEEGQSVQKGEPIAAVGSTGFSTGPHLHFEVRNNGEPIDPSAYL
ncbi:MAG: peptidoglycan DD-metalloendopeptidase family protein [Synechococcales bacterium]|nr:peptidoglycan DD-metalloendopeptidase family protein [Synechococcales bacterium]